jgi:hypothetical protein
MSNGTTADELVKYLEAIYDPSDPVFQALIANNTVTPNAAPTNPVDYGIGVLASVTQWNRDLCATLLTQMTLTTQNSYYLNWTLQNFLGFLKYDGETDAHLLNRALAFILAPKRSNAAIIYVLREFSTLEPVVTNGGLQDAAYADVSYCDNQTKFLVSSGKYAGTYIYPDWSLDVSGGLFMIIITLKGTTVLQQQIVKDYLTEWVADGISYRLYIAP